MSSSVINAHTHTHAQIHMQNTGSKHIMKEFKEIILCDI